jgi:hypothetical protein
METNESTLEEGEPTIRLGSFYFYLSLSLYTHNHGVFKQGKKTKKKLYIGFYKNKYTYVCLQRDSTDTQTIYTKFC